MRILPKIVLTLATAQYFICVPVAASPLDGSPFFAAPGAAYLHGIGPVYGGAAASKKLFSKEARLAAFKTFGQIESGGILLQDLRFLDKRLSVGAFFGILEEADFKTSYGRGFGESLVVRQAVKGNGGGLKLGYDVIAERLSVFAGYSYSILKFVDYKTRSGTVIPFRMDDLHDINTTMMSLEIKAALIPPSLENPNRLNFRGKYSTVEGRIGQSDLKLIDLRIKGREILSKWWSFSYTSRLQRTLVSSVAGSAAVDGNCAAVSDSALKQQCVRLEQDLTAFIAQSNRVGTGIPLGGSRGLRSFRELRFKAANTALAGVEAQLRVHPKYPAYLTAFYELGYAADKISTLYSGSRYSTGLGARVMLREVPIRAEFAVGPESRAAFLTFGLPW